MPIGPDGRIIRRGIRQMTPVNTNNPAPDINFFTGYISLIILSLIVLVTAYLIGWLGGLLINLSWWSGGTFLGFGVIAMLLFYPVFIEGILEGLYSYKKWLYKLYSFLYGAITAAILITLNQLGDEVFNYTNYLWAAGYGLYCLAVSNRIAD